MLRDSGSPRPTGARRAAALFVLCAGAAPFAALLDVHFLKDDLNLKTFCDADGRPSWDSFTRWFLLPNKETYPHDQFYRPLPMLIGFLEFEAFGPEPAALRASNVAFHALNGVLLALLVDRLSRGRRFYAACFAGLLFAVHPAHGEAVIWIAQRFVVHQTTWTLLGLLGLDAWLGAKSRGGLALVVGASLAAALTKESAAALPPIYAAYALLRPSEDGLPARLRRALLVGAAALAVPALVVGLRYALFGTVEGTYGGVSIAAYARANRTFERLPESLLNGVVGVNPYEAGTRATATAWPAFRVAAAVVWGLLAGVALLGLVRGLRTREVRGAAAFGFVLAAASLAPMLPIFYCEPWLAGARFLYQPLAGLAVAAVAGLFREPRDGESPAAYPAATAVVVAAVACAINAPAYRGADAQIRALKDGLLRESDAAPAAAFVLHRAPGEHHGVPTVDLYAPLLVAPPFADAAPPVFPVVAGTERTFDADEFARWRAGCEVAPLEHLYFAAAPFRVGRLFGPARPAAGEAPELFAPEDGATLGVPRAQNDAAGRALIAASEPTLAFSRTFGAARYRLHVSVAEAGDEGRPVPPRAFALTLDPERLERRGAGFRYRFSMRASDLPEGAQDPWTHLAVEGFEPPTLLLAWSIEALDADGRTLGVSEERRMALFSIRAAAAPR